MLRQTNPDFSDSPKWWIGRMNHWLRYYGLTAESVEDGLEKVRHNVPCTGWAYHCARCMEFGFPCPDPEAPHLRTTSLPGGGMRENMTYPPHRPDAFDDEVAYAGISYDNSA